MSKFLLNLLVQFLKVLPNSKNIENSKIKFLFESLLESGQSVMLAHSPSTGRHLPHWPSQPTHLWCIHGFTLSLLSCTFHPTRLLSPQLLTCGPHLSVPSPPPCRSSPVAPPPHPLTCGPRLSVPSPPLCCSSLVTPPPHPAAPTISHCPASLLEMLPQPLTQPP
jgi:hypothetical protein